MLRMRFEPMTPVFEQAKTVHALDRVASVIGFIQFQSHNICIILR
jgi:hypothetical protein